MGEVGERGERGVHGEVDVGDRGGGSPEDGHHVNHDGTDRPN